MNTFGTGSLLDDGNIKYWGRNDDGQLGKGHANSLGDGANEMGDNLTAIDLGTNLKAMEVQIVGAHSCAIISDGNIKCWGRGDEGQLGKGNTTDLGKSANQMGNNLTAINVDTNLWVMDVTTGNGNNSSCFMISNGTIKCWGQANFGQMGIASGAAHIGDGANEMGTFLNSINLGTGTLVKAFSAGYSKCGFMAGNVLKCWGYNPHGQHGLEHANDIGDNANEMGANLVATKLPTPKLVNLYHGGYAVCATFADLSFRCWGYGGEGALGHELTTSIGDNANEMYDNLVTSKVTGTNY